MAIKHYEITYLLIVCFYLLFLTGCDSEKMPGECRSFYLKPSTIRWNEIEQLDPAMQIVLQTCGLDMNPPVNYSYKIAKRGKMIIPILINGLRDVRASNDIAAEKKIYAIILIFEALAETGQLTKDQKVLKEIKDSSQSISSDWLKKQAEISIAAIEEKMKNT